MKTGAQKWVTHREKYITPDVFEKSIGSNKKSIVMKIVAHMIKGHNDHDNTTQEINRLNPGGIL